jgi:hypothetical protein
MARPSHLTRCLSLSSPPSYRPIAAPVATEHGELFSYTPRQLKGDENPDFIKVAQAWKITRTLSGTIISTTTTSLTEE